MKLSKRDLERIKTKYLYLINEQYPLDLKIGHARGILDVIYNHYKDDLNIQKEFAEAIREQQKRFEQNKKNNIRSPYEPKIKDSTSGWLTFLTKKEYIPKKFKDSFQFIYKEVSEPIHARETRDTVLLSSVVRLNEIIRWLFQEHQKSVGFLRPVQITSKQNENHPDQANKTTESPEQFFFGAEIIDDNFINRTKQDNVVTQFQYYLSKLDDLYQWAGVIKGYDIVRKETLSIIKECKSTFNQKSSSKVIGLVCGAGGSGKSTLLRRVALELVPENFTILWIKEYQFDDFVNKDWDRICTNQEENYLIIIEDWYRLANSYAVEGERFILKAKHVEHIRILIGDRNNDGLYRRSLNDTNAIFNLTHTDNWEIISRIINKNPNWNIKVEDVVKNETLINNSSLFLTLYTIIRVEEDKSAVIDYRITNPERAFQEIIASDLNKISASYKGLGKAIFYWASIYEQHKFHIAYDTFLGLADYFDDQKDITFTFQNLTDDDSEFHDILRNYLTIKESQGIEYIRFNHDTFADFGISKTQHLLNEPILYDDISKRNILRAIFQLRGDKKSIARLLFHFLHFEKKLFKDDIQRLSFIERLLDSGNTELSFLNSITELEINEELQLSFIKKLFASQIYPQTYIKEQMGTYPAVCSYILRNITDFNDLPANVYFDVKKSSSSFDDKQKAVNAILNADNILAYNDRVLADTLKVSNNPKAKINGIKKILTDTKDYLSIDKILLQRILRYANNDELTKAPVKAILNDDNITELPFEIVAEAFRKSQDDNDKLKASKRILNSDMVTDNARYKMVSKAMIECPDKNIKLGMAERIIKNSDQFHPSLKFHSLGCFTDEHPIPDFVVAKIDNIVANFMNKDNSKLRWYEYKRITRLPFHSIYSWKNATRYILKRGQRDRGFIHNVLLSYKAFPEETKRSCENILANWRDEIEIPIKQVRSEEPYHYGDHIKVALEHPHLKELANKTALEIRQAHADKSCNKVKLHLQKTISKILDS